MGIITTFCKMCKEPLSIRVNDEEKHFPEEFRDFLCKDCKRTEYITRTVREKFAPNSTENR